MIMFEERVGTIRAYLKQALQNVYTISSSTETPILIASTRRSGSTLLMEMIYSQPNMGFIGQPLGFARPHLYKHRLPEPNGIRYTTLNSRSIQNVATFLHKISTGQIRWRGQWNVFDDKYSFKVNRYVIKSLGTKTIIPEVENHLDMETIYLLRHPASCASSIIERGWGETSPQFLNDRSYLEMFLTPEQAEFCWSIVESGSKFERVVLEWCLENLCALRQLPNSDWLLLTYEELVSRPVRVSEWLANELDLADPKRMACQVQSPSKTTQNSSRRELEEQGPKRLAVQRFQKLSEGQRSSVAEIFDALDMDVYNAYTAAPAPWATQFGPIDFQKE